MGPDEGRRGALRRRDIENISTEPCFSGKPGLGWFWCFEQVGFGNHNLDPTVQTLSDQVECDGPLLPKPVIQWIRIVGPRLAQAGH
jgi:hypothetical protein